MLTKHSPEYSVSKKAVFLDRDGVINVDYGYVSQIGKVVFTSGIFEGLIRLSDLGFKLIVVTNQSGVARGYHTEEDVLNLHKFITKIMKKNGVVLDTFFYCPHHPNATIKQYKLECKCRKPQNGMIETAVAQYGIEKEKSILIGDKISDMQAAKKSNIKGFLFEGGDFNQFVEDYIIGSYLSR